MTYPLNNTDITFRTRLSKIKIPLGIYQFLKVSVLPQVASSGFGLWAKTLRGDNYCPLAKPRGGN